MILMAFLYSPQDHPIRWSGPAARAAATAIPHPLLQALCPGAAAPGVPRWRIVQGFRGKASLGSTLIIPYLGKNTQVIPDVL